MSESSREVEIKLRTTSAQEAERKLHDHGFHVVKPRIFEKNIAFDTSTQTLRQTASLLRVREADKQAKLTYKGPPDGGKHKSREELELDISDADKLIEIFGRLAFQPVFRYEKFRTEFREPGGDGVATVDETPIGVYIELEGEADWIDRTAHELGFAESDYITASYARLYFDWCKEHDVTPSNMVFA